MSRLPAIMTPEQLNAWYERNVGYRPQVDDPTMTDAELLALCLEVAGEQEYQGEPER